MKFRLWLLWVAAVLAAGCSCAEKKAQELSAYWNGHDFTTLDAFEDIDAAEDKFDGFIDLYVHDIDDLENLMKRLKNIKGLESVAKTEL